MTSLIPAPFRGAFRQKFNLRGILTRDDSETIAYFAAKRLAHICGLPKYRYEQAHRRLEREIVSSPPHLTLML
jgi:hypothetical protein